MWNRVNLNPVNFGYLSTGWRVTTVHPVGECLVFKWLLENHLHEHNFPGTQLFNRLHPPPQIPPPDLNWPIQNWTDPISYHKSPSFWASILRSQLLMLQKTVLSGQLSHALDATEMWASPLFTSHLFCAAVRQLFIDTEREHMLFHSHVFHW